MKRTDQKEITKNKLIKAAQELAETKLINEISVEDITKKAKVSKGSFYTYFNKKEDILDSFYYLNYDLIRNEALNSSFDFNKRINDYIFSFLRLIEESSKETCRSWISSNINNEKKLVFDNESLNLILLDAKNRGEIRIEDINKVSTLLNSFLYG